MVAIRSIADNPTLDEDLRLRWLRGVHSDVRLTANERRRVKALFCRPRSQQSMATLLSWDRRWDAFSQVWPRIGLAHLVLLATPERQRIRLPQAIMEMP